MDLREHLYNYLFRCWNPFKIIFAFFSFIIKFREINLQALMTLNFILINISQLKKKNFGT